MYIGLLYDMVAPYLDNETAPRSPEEEKMKKIQNGMTRDLKPNAPEDVRVAYSKLCKMFQEAARKGIAY